MENKSGVQWQSISQTGTATHSVYSLWKEAGRRPASQMTRQACIHITNESVSNMLDCFAFLKVCVRTFKQFKHVWLNFNKFKMLKTLWITNVSKYQNCLIQFRTVQHIIHLWFIQHSKIWRRGGGLVLKMGGGGGGIEVVGFWCLD